VERATPDEPNPDERDPAVEREAELAAQEAVRVGGGPDPSEPGHEAERPVEEAGGGVAEGFEQAEEALREAAEHGDAGRPADLDAFPAEAEPDPSTHGEPDEIESAEQPEGEDPEAG
jgi:hypothetical protein